MRYRALGRTGLNVSEIGFGAWGIGGDAGGSVAYGPADRDVSLRALRTALDRGITLYDTSDFYGHGRSVELIGEAFSGQRSAVGFRGACGALLQRALNVALDLLHLLLWRPGGHGDG